MKKRMRDDFENMASLSMRRAVVASAWSKAVNVLFVVNVERDV